MKINGEVKLSVEKGSLVNLNCEGSRSLEASMMDRRYQLQSVVERKVFS